MFPCRIGFALLLAVVIAGSAGRAALAGAVEVAPTTIELSPRTGGALVRITNRGAQAVTIQVRPYDWRQVGGKDTLTPSTTLVVSPTTAQLPPGGRQVVRLRERGPALVGEQAHRLVISELASGDAVAAGQVRMLLQFSLPVFGPPEGTGAARLLWDARVADGRLVLTAANGGARHAKLVNLAILGEGAASNSKLAPMAYVLAGASRSWRLPVGALAPPANLMLTADDGLTGGPLTWNLKVRRFGDGPAGSLLRGLGLRDVGG